MTNPTTPDLPTLLTQAQVQKLLEAIHPLRVATQDGNLHVQAYEVRAHMNRIFGFGGWEGRVTHSELIYENRYDSNAGKTKDGKPQDPWWKVSVGYRVRYRVDVFAWVYVMEGAVVEAYLPLDTTQDVTGLGIARVRVGSYEEEATGGAVNFPDVKRADAHDFAVKTAESQAFKRAVVNLGDQFGGALYAKGYAQNPQRPLVGRVLVGLATLGERDRMDMDEGLGAVTGEDVTSTFSTEEERQEAALAASEWVEAAAGMAGDEDAFDRLYNEARAAKVSPNTLAQMRTAAGFKAKPRQTRGQA